MEGRFVRRHFAVMMICVFASSPVSVFAGEVENASDSGSISGTVAFSGAVPEPVTYKPTKDLEICGPGLHVSDELAIGPEGGIRYAVVTLSGVSGGPALDRSVRPKLDQTGCRFVPHVVVVPRGGTLEIRNNDGILHNVRTTSSKNAPFNKAQLKFMRKIKNRFGAGPEKIQVNCDAHSWMSAWIVVADHAYYAVTDERGAFSFDDVPAGNYTLEYWYESLGTITGTVSVTAGQTVSAGAVYGKE